MSERGRKEIKWKTERTPRREKEEEDVKVDVHSSIREIHNGVDFNWRIVAHGELLLKERKSVRMKKQQWEAIMYWPWAPTSPLYLLGQWDRAPICGHLDVQHKNGLLINGETWPPVQVIYETSTINQQKMYIWTWVSGSVWAGLADQLHWTTATIYQFNYWMLTVMGANATRMETNLSIHAGAQNIILCKSCGNMTAQKELWWDSSLK